MQLADMLEAGAHIDAHDVKGPPRGISASFRYGVNVRGRILYDRRQPFPARSILESSRMAANPADTAPSLDAYWMPFTANRQFKDKPRMLARAAGMYYESVDGRKILDGAAGL